MKHIKIQLFAFFFLLIFFGFYFYNPYAFLGFLDLHSKSDLKFFNYNLHVKGLAALDNIPNKSRNGNGADYKGILHAYLSTTSEEFNYKKNISSSYQTSSSAFENRINLYKRAFSNFTLHNQNMYNSLIEVNKSITGIKILPKNLENYYEYNASITSYKDKYLMIYRAAKKLCSETKLNSPAKCQNMFYDNKFFAIFLDKNLNVISAPKEISAKLPNCFDNLCIVNDARLIKFKNNYYIIYNNNIEDVIANMNIAKLEITDNDIKITQTSKISLPFKPLRAEKNWAPLVLKDHLFLIYSIEPETITLDLDPETGLCQTASYNKFNSGYSFGNLRGGTNFIETGKKDEYFAIVHSVVNFYNNKNILSKKYYITGITLTCAETGCKVAKLGYTPLLHDYVDPGNTSNLSAIFPEGLIEQDNKLVTSLGLNDKQIMLITLDKDKYIQNLAEVN